ncbi:MAG: hypothetical protein M1600_10195 [Firmicutes bacterium]|nr:hypothetical protein [Bacillota bacterium]
MVDLACSSCPMTHEILVGKRWTGRRRHRLTCNGSHGGCERYLRWTATNGDVRLGFGRRSGAALIVSHRSSHSRGAALSQIADWGWVLLS